MKTYRSILLYLSPMILPSSKKYGPILALSVQGTRLLTIEPLAAPHIPPVDAQNPKSYSWVFLHPRQCKATLIRVRFVPKVLQINCKLSETMFRVLNPGLLILRSECHSSLQFVREIPQFLFQKPHYCCL